MAKKKSDKTPQEKHDTVMEILYRFEKQLEVAKHKDLREVVEHLRAVKELADAHRQSVTSETQAQKYWDWLYLSVEILEMNAMSYGIGSLDTPVEQGKTDNTSAD